MLTNGGLLRQLRWLWQPSRLCMCGAKQADCCEMRARPKSLSIIQLKAQQNAAVNVNLTETLGTRHVPSFTIERLPLLLATSAAGQSSALRTPQRANSPPNTRPSFNPLVPLVSKKRTEAPAVELPFGQSRIILVQRRFAGMSFHTHMGVSQNLGPLKWLVSFLFFF